MLRPEKSILAPAALALAAVLLLAMLVPRPALPAAEEDEDEYFGLPEDAGREEVLAYCGSCHSLRLVIQQGLPRTEWADLLVWMYEEQEMEPLEPEEEVLVLDYLGKHVGPDSHKARLRERGILR